MGKKIRLELNQEDKLETNLMSAKEYGGPYALSVEQVKQYCHQKDRVPCAMKNGRDWLNPRDAGLPEDLRGKRKTPRKRKVAAQE